MTDTDMDHNENTRTTDRQADGLIVLNPASGDGTHVDAVYPRAEERGYTVRETTEGGDAAALAKEAVEAGVRLLAACGGDGTIHQVVYGLYQADALDDTTVAVIPGGTGNNFAQNIGVNSIEQAFELLETGERRQIDLGVANDEPFVNSCIAGITAKTSSETDPDMKERFGTLAYVLTGLREAAGFDPLHVEINAEGTTDAELETWTGDVLCILVGNARRFTNDGGQAGAEDGQFRTMIVEEMPTNEMFTETAVQQLFGTETEHITQFSSDSLEITSQQDNAVEFSLDGEMSTHTQLSLCVLPHALEIVVGPDYTPEPDDHE